MIVRFLVDASSFALALGRLVWMRAILRRPRPIRLSLWPAMVCALWTYIRTDRPALTQEALVRSAK